MSIETPERTHDGERLPEGGRADGSDWRPDTDEELVVVVCPQRIYEQLRPELDDWRERLCREYEREYEDLLAERAQLEDEVDCLERRLARKESQLDAVITRNEQILESRTESYRDRIDGSSEADDDFEWTGRKQEAGLLARVKSWFR
ncbi:hypothetical protein [Halorussus salinisoli]|uniref:hypothetical protein n=1 Tax=Halorussus salinisoli TaxID=2558242 RepID=UPI0010C1A6A4|nr:hypothetical protein [Halorussus salinisoli]